MSYRNKVYNPLHTITEIGEFGNATDFISAKSGWTGSDNMLQIQV